MPVFRHMCPVCKARTEDLLKSADSPPPEHCGSAMVRLMGAPFGRVAGSITPVAPRKGPMPTPAPRGPQGRATRWGFNREPSEVVGEGRAAVQPQRQARPEMPGPAMPTRTWSKPYEACDAAQRDERWRDSCQQMTQYRADCLAASGVDYGTALKTASEGQQAATADARAQLGRG